MYYEVQNVILDTKTRLLWSKSLHFIYIYIYAVEMPILLSATCSCFPYRSLLSSVMHRGCCCSFPVCGALWFPTSKCYNSGLAVCKHTLNTLQMQFPVLRAKLPWMAIPPFNIMCRKTSISSSPLVFRKNKRM